MFESEDQVFFCKLYITKKSNKSVTLWSLPTLCLFFLSFYLVESRQVAVEDVVAFWSCQLSCLLLQHLILFFLVLHDLFLYFLKCSMGLSEWQVFSKMSLASAEGMSRLAKLDNIDSDLCVPTLKLIVSMFLIFINCTMYYI